MNEADTIKEPVTAIRIESNPLKQRDLLKCVCCQQGLMHDQAMTCFRIRLTRYIFDMQAIRRQHGLEMSFEPAPMLASIMGPDPDLALPLDPGFEALICEGFAMKSTVWEVAESGSVDDGETTELEK